jgi:hypothetical protein
MPSMATWSHVAEMFGSSKVERASKLLHSAALSSPEGMDVPLRPESEVWRRSAPFACGSETPRAVIVALRRARSATAPTVSRSP